MSAVDVDVGAVIGSVAFKIVEGFANSSTWLSITPILIGLAFMSGGKGALANDFAELATLKGQSCTGEVGAWSTHLIFFGGVRASRPRHVAPVAMISAPRSL